MALSKCACSAFVFGWLFAIPASASPGFDFVCFNEGFSAQVGLDLEWSTAYLTVDGVQSALSATETNSDRGQFEFSNDTSRFFGWAPTGRLEHTNGFAADCFQTRESLTALALYGADTDYKWPRFMANGQGFQTVRAMPSPLSPKLASLEAGTPVTIVENTGEFLEGFFWFRTVFEQGREGYIWGALLCSDVDDPVLNAVVRRCS